MIRFLASKRHKYLHKSSLHQRDELNHVDSQLWFANNPGKNDSRPSSNSAFVELKSISPGQAAYLIYVSFRRVVSSEGKNAESEFPAKRYGNLTFQGIREMAGNLHEFTDANFEDDVLKSSEPVLVDFWAPWCGPCRMLMPTIEELAEEFAGKVKIGKVNTDDNQKTAAAYGITSIPTVMLFKDGEMVDKVVGAPPKAHFEKMLGTAVG